MAPMMVGFFSIHCLLVHAASPDRPNPNYSLLLIASLLADEENQ